MQLRGPALAGIALCALSLPAHAQRIPTIVAIGALTPILVLLLIVVMAWLARSFRLGAIHAALLFTWLFLFWAASYLQENDYVIWSVLAAYAVHSLVIVALIVWYAFARARAKPHRSGA